jgi:hypothetical protein
MEHKPFVDLKAIADLKQEYRGLTRLERLTRWAELPIRRGTSQLPATSCEKGAGQQRHSLPEIPLDPLDLPVWTSE